MKSKRVLMWIVVIFSGLILLPFFSMAQEIKPAGQSEEEYFKLIRANQVSGQIDPQDLLTARDQVEKMKNMKNGAALGLNWEEMGPDNLGSRTRAIIIDKNNPSVLYIGAVTGGIWKSTSGGSSWVQTLVNGTKEEVLNVTCMAQAANGEIWAGTGEGFYTPTGTSRGGIVGQGLYKSTDGMNFTLIPGTKPVMNSTTTDWALINRIAFGQNNKLYVATNKGLKYSDDGGANWNYTKSDGQDLTENAWDIKIGSSGVIAVCVGNKCYISDNGDPLGFVNHSVGGTGNLPTPNNVSRIELAIAPSNNNVIYAVVAKSTGALENIYRSSDKGMTWSVVGPGGSSSFNLFNLGTVTNTGLGQYAMAITVNPTDENIILVGGVNLWRGNKVDAGYYSWQQVTEGGFPSWYGLYLHYYHHAYVYSPQNSNTIYIVTDGGISVSTNGGITFGGLNRKYNVTQSYTVAPTYNGPVMTGTQGNGVQYISLEGNTPQAATEFIPGQVGGYCAASFINPKVYFIGTTNGSSRRTIDRGENFSSYYASNMSNLTGAYITPLLLWENFNDQNSKDSVRFISYDTILPGENFVVKSFNGDYPFVVTNQGLTIYPHDTVYVKDIVTTKFFLGVNGGLYYTKKALDFTATPVWYKIANFTGTVQSMAYTYDGNNVFLGLQEGLLLRIRDIDTWAGDTSNNVKVDTIMNKPNRAITSVAVDPRNAEHLVFTLGNYGNADHVYETTNALDTLPTFSLKQGNLPAMPVYASLIEMSNSNRVMVGTDLGVFATDNFNAASPTWTQENSGLANVPVMMLKQQSFIHWPIIDQNDTAYVNNYGVIYAASHGRGVFKCGNFVGIDNPTKPQTPSDQLSIYPNPVMNEATVTYTLPQAARVNIQILNITGQLVKEMMLPNQSAGTHSQTLTFDKQLPSGTYLLKVSAGKYNKIGKFIAW